MKAMDINWQTGLVKVFIDDERTPIGPGWDVIRNMADFVEFVEQFGFPDYISFDHDLGKDRPTGYDIAKWVVDRDLDGIHHLPDKFSFYVHSQNPIGKKNIESLLNNYLKVKHAE